MASRNPLRAAGRGPASPTHASAALAEQRSRATKIRALEKLESAELVLRMVVVFLATSGGNHSRASRLIPTGLSSGGTTLDVIPSAPPANQRRKKAAHTVSSRDRYTLVLSQPIWYPERDSWSLREEGPDFARTAKVSPPLTPRRHSSLRKPSSFGLVCSRPDHSLRPVKLFASVSLFD